MKKLITLFFALIVAHCAWAYDFIVGSIAYNITSANTVEVTSGGTYTGSITIPSTVVYSSVTYNVTSIGLRAFEKCTGLTSITIPSSVTLIDYYAFSGSTGLTAVTIPSSVTSIGDGAFEYCSGLTSINVNAANSNYSSFNGVIFDKDKTTIVCYPGGKQGAYTIPSSVTSIGVQAFFDCTGLTSIIIPGSVTSIRNGAFVYCSGLTSIYAYPTTPANCLSSFVFEYVNTTCTLYVPIGSKAAYQMATQWKDFTNMTEFVTAVPTVTNESISIYPNPVTDGFRIKGLEGTSEIRLTDLYGKALLSKQVIGSEKVSLIEFPAGMYMVNLSNNGVNYQKKLVKK